MKRTRLALASLLLIPFLALASCATNPVTGQPQLQLVSDDKANTMGRDAYPTIRQEWGGDFNDPELQAYVAEVGKKLAENSHSPELPYSFHVTNSSQLNAVCLPGGKIFITRGLLSKLENEAQMAAVLGHEVGHATARHAQQAMTRGVLLQVGLTAASLWVDMNTDSTSDALIGYAALQAGAVGAQLVQMKYGRDQEHQSDELGVQYMMAAGYHPDAAIEVQELLASKEKDSPSTFEALFRSHPVSEERVDHIKRYVYENEPGSAYKREGDGIFKERFLEKTAKIRTVSRGFEHYQKAQTAFKEGRTRDALNENKKAIQTAPGQAAFHVQKGDFMMAAKDYDKAEKAYKRAVELQPDYYLPHQRLGELAKVRGDKEEALTHHKEAMKLNANASTAYIQSGYIYQEKGEHDKAAAMLQAGTQFDSDNGKAYTALGKSLEKTGRHEEAYHAYRSGYKYAKDKKTKEQAGKKLNMYQQLTGP